MRLGHCQFIFQFERKYLSTPSMDEAEVWTVENKNIDKFVELFGLQSALFFRQSYE